MPEEARPRAEPSHLSVRLVTGVLAAIVVVVCLAATAVWFTIAGLGGHNRTAPARLPDHEAGFPGPRLRIAPQGEPEAYLREEEPLLRQWGWADRSHSTAHIPVDAAVDLLARRGWPDGSQGEASR